MKRSDFKRAIFLRWKIITTCTMFNFRESLAYAGNNWASLLSMLTYMVTYLLFLDILFGRVKMIAGYNYSEMLFFTLIVQINFYLTAVLSHRSIEEMNTNINTGTLDLWLVRPVPAMWFVTFQKINLNELILGAIPAMIPLLVILSGRWTTLSISFVGVMSGIICVLMGQVIIHCFQFMLAMTTFFTGEGKQARGMGLELSLFGDAIPFEGYPRFVKIIGLTAIPFIVHTALAASFFLGKNTNYLMLIYVLFLMILFLWGKAVLWKFSLRYYSSASS